MKSNIEGDGSNLLRTELMIGAVKTQIKGALGIFEEYDLDITQQERDSIREPLEEALEKAKGLMKDVGEEAETAWLEHKFGMESE